MISTNEKTAKKLSKLIGDWEINPEQVGKYIARMNPDFVLTKLQIIANSAIMESNRETEEFNISYILEGDQNFN